MMQANYRVTLTALLMLTTLSTTLPATVAQAQNRQPGGVVGRDFVRIGACPKPYSLKIRKRKVACVKVVKRRIKDYKPYKPCVGPGVYRRNDEAPGTGGKDRCTTSGVSGPALPCPPNAPKREIRRRKVDRCYKIKTVRGKEFGNLELERKTGKQVRTLF